MSKILTLPKLESLRTPRKFLVPSFSGKLSQAKWRVHGFSMVELMVTMAILIIVLMVAAPQFQTSTPTYEANGLYSDIEFARSSAIKSGQTVIICASADGATCNASKSWATGWIVLMPGAGNCTSLGGATGDLVLRATSALTSGDSATFTQATGGSTNYFCLNRMGYSQAANNGMVTFKKANGNKQLQSCVSVAGVGHSQVLAYGASDITGVTCT